jgi:hypothetical protein
LHLQHRGIDPASLSPGGTRRYRDLILWVGGAAINEGRGAKALDILKRLEDFRDGTSQERLFLAHAYLLAAEGLEVPGWRQRYQEQALELYRQLYDSDRGNAEIAWRPRGMNASPPGPVGMWRCRR